MADLADLSIRLGINDQLDSGIAGADSKIDAFAKKMDRVGSGMQDVGKKMSLFATLPIAAGFAKMTGSAETLNESVNAVNQVFGDAAGTIHEFAKTSASSVGLSASAFNELATPVGAMLQNVGFGADEAAQATIDLSKRAADMASVFNTDVDDAMAAIQAGLRGQADPLEKFGVGLTAAAVDAHALEMGLADTAAELTDNQKAQARLSLLMEQTDRVAGDFAATSEESANAQRIAAARAEDLAATLGQNLIPIKTKALEVVNGLLDKFDAMSPTMQTAAVAVAGIVAAAGPLLFITGTLVRSVGAVAKAFGAVAGAAPAMLSAAQSVASGAATAVSALGRWIAAGATWVAQQVANAARAVASMAVTAAQFVAHYARMAAASMVNAVRMAASWVVAMGPVGWVIAGIVALVALIIANWDKVVRFTKAMAEKVAGWFRSARDWVVGTATDLRDKVVGFFTDLRDKAVTKATELRDRVVGFFGDLRDKVVGIATGVRDKVVEFFTGLKDSAIEKVEGLVDRVKQIKDDVLGFFSGAKDWLIDAGKNIIQGLIDGIGSMARALGDKVSGVVSSITDRLPWSPAKKGPLASHRPEVGGANIIRQLAEGMGSEVGTLAEMADRAAMAALPGLQTPGLAKIGTVNGRSAGQPTSDMPPSASLDPEEWGRRAADAFARRNQVLARVS